MSYSYPTNFEIEIDREPLTRYLRAQHQMIWFYLMLVGGLFAGSMSAANYYESHVSLPWTTILWPVGWRFLCIVLALQLLGAIGYMLSVRTVSTYVESLLVSVEGPFLRIRKSVGGVEHDRKIHFRLLHIYSTKQDARMKKLGISTPVMTTSVSLQPTRTIDRTIEVPGVKDCLKVRDMLSEIDNQRENT
ncbi:MAG: hypothetical protein JWM57_4126 [Phycisphaerales bacterium]|nr:hypothetical protein [Phycisphaerales bacterium]